MKKWFLIGIVLFISGRGNAQTVRPDGEKGAAVKIVVSDTAAIVKGDTSLLKTNKKWVPNPKKATKLAAILPGSGQIYNRDYWKVPLVYAAFAGGTWTAIYWNVRYQDFVRGYKTFYDLNEGSAKYGQLKDGVTSDTRLPVFYRGGILNGERVDSLALTVDQVRREKNRYRRFRETAIVFTVALYALSIIEANVAAHLKTFDLSEDLSLNVAPKVQQPNMTRPTPGISLVFNFKR
ncbi:DUF5683 domain-containing protein [Dyadobacter sp. CY345]|uniref:DUF5683 domain-containing protein n=1 Tax=Dyadobacter sp. CY345 TaxID=2909335 RepID=UPI001F464FAB|nr:DUF5683 domain-containing protein [Dyadobacter sp. CY345]MCF2444184.1 DUF5683 domain-containing protein [Dyadobacter sp. CY345]